ncbi:MAG TPA: hypothetical protein VFM21_03975, partial [Terriglobia bacterium]|nr:hypothetical protein [Terriglobia bacterium]
MRKLIPFLAVVLLLAALPCGATTFTYTDLATWAASSPYSSASGTTLPGMTITAQNPTAGFGVSPNSSCSNPCAFAGSTVWYDEMIPNTYTTTVTFNQAQYGFGGLWDLYGPSGPGTSLNVYADGVFVGNIANTLHGTFWGFQSTTAFTNVLLTAGPSCCVEKYEVGTFYASNVPEPT